MTDATSGASTALSLHHFISLVPSTFQGTIGIMYPVHIDLGRWYYLTHLEVLFCFVSFPHLLDSFFNADEIPQWVRAKRDPELVPGITFSSYL